MTPTQRESVRTLYRALPAHYPRAPVGDILDGVRKFLNGYSRGRLPDNAKPQICEGCGVEYTPRHKQQRYCSDDCRLKTWRQNRKERRDTRRA